MWLLLSLKVPLSKGTCQLKDLRPLGWGLQTIYHFGRVFPEEPNIHPVATWVSRTWLRRTLMSFPVFLPTTSIRQKSLESPVPFCHANIPLEKKNYKNRKKKRKNVQTRRHTELSTANRKFWNSAGGKAKQTSPDHPHSHFTGEIPHQEDIILDISNHSQIHLYLANLNFVCFQFILDCSSELQHKQG